MPDQFSFGSSTPGSSSGGNLFGSTPASSAPGGSLFGSGLPASTAAGGIFGSTPSTSTTSAQGLFGQAATQPSSTAQSSQTSLFTGGSNAANSPFAGFKLSATGTTPGSITSGPASGLGGTATSSKPDTGSGVGTGSNNIFGATTSANTGLFGGGLGTTANSQSGTTTPAKAQTFSFGNLSTTPAGPPPSAGGQSSSLFSQSAPSQEPKPSLFGALGPSTSAQTSSTAAPTNTLLGGSSTLSAKPQNLTSGLFGGGGGGGSSTAQTSSTNAPSSNLFAPGSNQLGSGSGNLFGMGKPAASAASVPPPQNAQLPTTGAGTTSSLFGNPSKPPTSSTSNQSDQKPTPTLFGNLGGQQSSSTASVQTAAPLFGGSVGTSQAPATGISTTQTAPPILGNNPSTSATATNPQFNLGISAPNSRAPQPTLFESSGPSKVANTSGASTLPAATQSSTPSLFVPPAQTTEASKSSENLGANQAPVQPTTAVPATDSSKSATLGASTSGPKPTPQSRLKNKSMDEIITRWANDLTKYQKEFQNQAKKVTQWDRILVENSDKIMKLYGSTLEAERATLEVERQLAAVENDQAELEYWLDTYEKQVDEMTSSQVGSGDSLTGPDQERERTYKLAEKLSDRLDEMGKDLTGMVEEINDASSHLSKNTKPDDPLSQIVRVLNGHLSQLQAIDQGTAALQAKVATAQKASRGLSVANGNGLGNDSVDDFYRSYTRGR